MLLARRLRRRHRYRSEEFLAQHLVHDGARALGDIHTRALVSGALDVHEALHEARAARVRVGDDVRVVLRRQRVLALVNHILRPHLQLGRLLRRREPGRGLPGCATARRVVAQCLNAVRRRDLADETELFLPCGTADDILV